MELKDLSTTQKIIAIVSISIILTALILSILYAR